MITTIQENRTRAATHLALIGASSPALMFQSWFYREKYKTVIAPMGRNIIFGVKVVSFT